jgi:hypothetical protein
MPAMAWSRSTRASRPAVGSSETASDVYTVARALTVAARVVGSPMEAILPTLAFASRSADGNV